MTSTIKGLGAAMLILNAQKPTEEQENARQLRLVFQSTPYYRVRLGQVEVQKAIEQLATGATNSLGRWDWQELSTIRDGNIYNAAHSRICYTALGRASNDHRFDWAPGQKFQMIYFGKKNSPFLGPFPDDDAEKVEFLVQKYKEAANVLEPEFAVIDDFEFSIAKRKGKDLRVFGWGAAVYGPALVKQIGRQKIQSAPAYRVEELPWGGVWVQAAKNPFQAVPEAKKGIEKHLGLKELFGASKEVKPKRTK